MARMATDGVAHAGPVDARDEPRGAAGARGRWVLPAAAAVVLAIGAWNYRWMSDDAFITLRVVKQLVAGHGPVFNVGERVEASTSPLWTFVLAVFDVLTPIRLEWIAVLLGIALTIAGFVCIMVGSSLLFGGRSRADMLVPAGALVLAVYAPMWKFASSGLETGLSFLWLGACLVVLARATRGNEPIPVWGLVVLGLGPLVRPDFLLYSLAFVALAAVFEAGNGRRVRAVAVAFALPVAYQLFRMGYYGSVVPNTALAKEASRP
jgi:arabinofuranosyltransferase